MGRSGFGQGEVLVCVCFLILGWEKLEFVLSGVVPRCDSVWRGVSCPNHAREVCSYPVNVCTMYVWCRPPNVVN